LVFSTHKRRKIMPIAGISKFIKPTTRHLIDAAWDDAWRELKKGGLVNAAFARRKLARTIVTLAAAGETDADTLKRYALCVTRSALLSEEVARRRWSTIRTPSDRRSNSG
jgi:hypothetical protein